MALPVPDEARGRSILSSLKIAVSGPETARWVDWSGDEIVHFMECWGFKAGAQEAEHRLVVHPDHLDMDLWIPMLDRVSYRYVVCRAVELVELLVSRLESTAASKGDS